MGIGELAWERHGHIALCIRYHDAEQDVCYNYGIGNFHDPGKMAWGFFRGTESFWAGEQTVDELLRIYVGRDRTVWAQPIPLTPDQKRQVIAKLQADTSDIGIPDPHDPSRRLPRPNRTPGKNLYYSYDHFWDNCTTRVRDILDDATGGELKSVTDETDGKTFRELARDGFYGLRLFLVITDIGMGRVTDRVPTYWERMFLPQYLREGAERRWGIKPILLYERRGPIASDTQDLDADGIADFHEDANGNGIPDLEEDSEHKSGRLQLALIILLVTSPVLLTRWLGRFQRLGIAIAIIPPVLIGSVQWFLAIISPLPYVEWNESCLVFFPFDLALLVLPAAKRRAHPEGAGSPFSSQAYARGRVIMLALMAVLMLVDVLKQPLFAPMLWPLIPALVVAFWRPEWSRARPATTTAKPAATERPADDAKPGARLASRPTRKPRR